MATLYARNVREPQYISTSFDKQSKASKGLLKIGDMRGDFQSNQIIEGLERLYQTHEPKFMRLR